MIYTHKRHTHLILLMLASASGVVTADELRFKNPPQAKYTVAPDLMVGADMVVSFEHSDNLDLSNDDDHLSLIEPEIRAVASYMLSPRAKLYGELQLDGRSFVSKGRDNADKSEGHVRLEQLYLDLSEVSESLHIRLGRQRFKDKRAWWFDEKIDAVRLNWQIGDWFLNVAAARDKSFADDFAHPDTDKKTDFLIASGGLVRGKRDQTIAYAIRRNDLDTGRPEDPWFLGVQRIGKINSDTRYWTNAAVVRGGARDRKIRAFGIDAGVSARLDMAWRPFITASIAYGSGDNSLSDGIDGNFRQTGLQDNEGRTFGIASYNYYGEVTDFELGNLWIATLGVGVRPSDTLSAEITYHRYRQVDANDDLFDSDLETDPEGKNKDLGHEVDLVLSYRPTKKTKISLTSGVFAPGDAFGNKTDTAWIAKLKFAYRF